MIGRWIKMRDERSYPVLVTRVTAWAVATAFVSLVSIAPVAAGEALGFGAAKFKMSPAEVQKIFPKMEPLEKALAAPVVGGDYVKRFLLPKVAVPGLEKPADIELRFWADRLWVVLVYFEGNDTDAVIAALQKQIGSEGGSDKNFVTWVGDASTTVLTRRGQYYSFSDNELGAEARAAIFKGIGTHHEPVKKAAGAASSRARGVDAKAAPKGTEESEATGGKQP